MLRIDDSEIVDIFVGQLKSGAVLCSRHRINITVQNYAAHTAVM